MMKLSCFLIFLSLVKQSSAGTPPALGEKCYFTEECTYSDVNSECDTDFTDTCICRTNYMEVFAVCTTIIGMGCTLTAQCTDALANTVCSSSQCACATGHTGNDCSAVVGMECTSTSQCTDALSNTVCSSSLCVCISGFTGTSCTAVDGMVCTSTSECTDVLANTVCSSSQCTCVSGYTGATCTDTVIGMSCANDCDCQDVLLNTVCTSNKCECAAGFCFSGLVCRSSSARKLSTTTMIPIATILLTVIYMRLV